MSDITKEEARQARMARYEAKRLARRAEAHQRNLKKFGVGCALCNKVLMPLNIRHHMKTCAKNLVAAAEAARAEESK